MDASQVQLDQFLKDEISEHLESLGEEFVQYFEVSEEQKAQMRLAAQGNTQGSFTMGFCVRAVLLSGLLVAMDLNSSKGASAEDDPHGDVPMGVSNEVCDDGKKHIEIDWNPNSTEEYTCSERSRKKIEPQPRIYHCDEDAKRPLHKCYPEAIEYDEDLPTSGSHRPLWPKYGEYRYLPPQRWLHSLEHGAIVFLYHPCADQDKIEKFKSVAKQCLFRHIISPSKKLPPNMNFALLSWKCKLLLSNPDQRVMVTFIKLHAKRAPEGHVRADGQYDIAIEEHAKIVTDAADSKVCQSLDILEQLEGIVKQKFQIKKMKSQQLDRDMQASVDRFVEYYGN